MRHILINHIAKIEGHGTFEADLMEGNLGSARLKVLIGARLFESIVLGRHYKEAYMVASRICGICSVAHHITGTKALEAAFKIKITPQADRLRTILIMSELIQSHAAHIFFLAAGDFFQIDSDLDLIKKYPQIGKEVILIRDFGNRIKNIIGGRDMHILSSEVGGFTRLPEENDLRELLAESNEVLKAAIDLAEFTSKIDYPKYERKVEFISLGRGKEYPFYDGEMTSTEGMKKSVTEFYKEVDELQRSYDAVKHVLYKGETFMLGALARVNKHHQALNEEARKFLPGIKPLPNYNIFYNTYAQAIEVVHCVEETQKLIKLYLKDKSRNVFTDFKVKAGFGVGAVEAPRGAVYHAYEVDKYGIIRGANIIAPTSQFLPNLENDLKKYITEHPELSKKEQRRRILMLVRAYDPCLTCAVH